MLKRRRKHISEEGGSYKKNFREIFKETGFFILDILYNAVIIIILVILIRSFLISPFRVVGSSMADTLQSNEFILIDKLSYRIGEPERGDPIVFKPPITDKYSYKFEGEVITGADGIGRLDLSNLQTTKNVIYCKNKLVKNFWFCMDSVRAKDLVYYVMAGNNNVNWKNAGKREVTLEEAEGKMLTLEGDSDKKYKVRIYDTNGPEFFVKRIIGIPGDTVKIENGRVYLKTPESDDFTEINEPYLNSNNRFNTYFKQMVGNNTFTIPEGYYFTLGDNRQYSNDSRSWFSPIMQEPAPYVSFESISGKVLLTLWPIQNIRFISGAEL